MLDNPVKKLIESEINLPSPPAIAVQILNTVQQEESDLNDLTKIISADPALTGKMLQIANSSFYSLETEVTSIERALSVLGTNVIKNIALSFVIAIDLRGKNHTGFDFDNYWRQSVTSAVAAALLSKHLGQNNDDIFVTALLHNIGMLIFFLNKKEEYSQLLQITDLATKSLIEAERRAFKYDHQQAGALLIKKWGLPDQIAEPINYHHSPESAPEEYQSTAYILQFADRISAIYTETDSAEKVRILQSDLENQYSFDQDSIRILLDQVAEQSFGILKTFEIEPGDMKPYSQMLQEANEELGRLNLSYEQLVIELKEAKDKSDRLANELSDANLRLNDLVYIDALTGAYNHRYFQENLSTELARAERYNFSVSLILFDIDDFKIVNDTCGHPAGDKVLTNIVRAIKKTVRPSDVVARYGGEEFAVILPETDISGLKVFAARLRRCVEGLTTTTEGKQIKVTISVGGTTYQSDQPVGKEALIKTADIGLYRSKENGRNQVTLLAPNGNSPI